MYVINFQIYSFVNQSTSNIEHFVLTSIGRHHWHELATLNSERDCSIRVFCKQVCDSKLYIPVPLIKPTNPTHLKADKPGSTLHTH